MIVIAVAWIYVVLMMALVEATSSQGTLLGAVITFFLYGVLPLSIVMFILGTGRRRARRAAQEAESAQPDGGSVAAGDTVAAERKEP